VDDENGEAVKDELLTRACTVDREKTDELDYWWTLKMVRL